MRLAAVLLLQLVSGPVASALSSAANAANAGLSMATANPKARLFAALQLRKRAISEMEEATAEVGETEDDATCARAKRLRVAGAVAATTLPPGNYDTRDAEQVEEESRLKAMYRQTLKNVVKELPGIGRGNSVANDTASRKRLPLRYPNAAGGIFGASSSSDIRYKTGMEKAEFEDFFQATCTDAQGNQLPRSWLFGEARNNLGKHSADDNKTRRTIRGSMNDRDRVLCWLEMLRRDTVFQDMAEKYGRCAGTYHNEFKDMTMAAQNMPCLLEEIQWPDADERAAHARFLQEWGHPELVGCAYIADGTMVNMRNPSKVGKGQPEPHDAVHLENYSGNKGLGTSHIVYCNIRGRILRIETVTGATSDRGAHLSSRVYTHPSEFLSLGEVGMGDGNYQGVARADSNELFMLVPYKKPTVGQLSSAAKRYNTEQRRFRVVVENSIGQIKKWKVVGNGKGFRHQRKFETPVFNVCARLTARIMRVRDAYPRSKEWVGDKKEGWEAKLGVHYYWDYEDPACYFLHGEGEDYAYGTVEPGTAADLQTRWDQIWLDLGD